MNATNLFQDVTSSSGIQWSGQVGNDAFSIGWIDFNSDGLADLWISPHGYASTPEPKVPSLYLNQGGGQFSNITSQIWPLGIDADTHGSSWADFDNDGDPDLLVSVGADLGRGEGGHLLFVNNGGRLEPQANARGLLYALGRGRSPLWFDENRDGLLDALLLTAQRPDGQAPSAVFRQSLSGQFSNVSQSVGFNSPHPARSAQLADLTNDESLDLMVQGTYANPLKTYDISETPYHSLGQVVPITRDYPIDATHDFEDTKAPRDTAIADYNGDGYPDLFLPRSFVSTSKSSLFRSVNGKVAAADLLLNSPGEFGISFKVNGNFNIDFLDRDPPRTNKIFIGTQGVNPPQTFFTLSSTDPDAVGIKPHTPGVDTGIYIGYMPATQTWQAVFSSAKADRINLLVQAEHKLSKVIPVGFRSPSQAQNAIKPRLLVSDSVQHRYLDKTVDAGLGKPILGQYAVAGDFDNDMDVDLYVTCSYPNVDVPDIFYRNQGNGTFLADSTAIPDNRTALGPQRTDFSLGPKVAVADYDNDGFLDLFTSDITFKATQKTYLGTPSRLLHNAGNDNHWLEVNLQGVTSNRDGIGTKVTVVAGGVTQVREQSGGMHQFSQNQQRIHLGLGKNTTVDQLTVKWSSGLVKNLSNISVDQLLTVIENSPSSGFKKLRNR